MLLATYGLIRGQAAGWGSPEIVGALVAAAALVVAFVVAERRAADPMLPPSLFAIPPFTGTAIVAFAQSVALYPLFLFLAIWFQDGLGYTPLETGVRMLPINLVIFVVAPLAGRLTGRIALRVPLASGLVLVGVSLLLMHGLQASSPWTAILPGYLVGGLAIGLISPSLAAAMVGVLSVQESGLASGIAGLGAIFAAQGAITDGLNAVFVVAALVAFAGAALAWPLLGDLRSESPSQPSQAPSSSSAPGTT